MTDSPNSSSETPFEQRSQAAEPFIPPANPPAPRAEEASGSGDMVTWTASEFIAHEKTSAWYITLGVGAVLVAFALYILTKDPIDSAVIITVALLLGVFGARQPRQLQYSLGSQSIGIEERQYPYALFRSFSVIPEGAFASIVFMPLKRFSVPLTIYYAPEQEERIIEILSDRLPFEHRAPDMVDRLMTRIRF